MTMTVGVVEQVATKDVSTKFGVKPTFSLKVNGSWVKCGFKNPKANVGDTVEFDGVTGMYGVETKAVNIVARGSGPVSMPATSAAVPTPRGAAISGGGYKEKVFPIPPLHGDRAIIRQNALARATDLVIAASGGKPYEVDESRLNIIIGFARKFESYTAGDLDLAEAMTEVAISEAAASE